jgi:hypothetical protein
MNFKNSVVRKKKLNKKEFKALLIKTETLLD